MSKQSGIFLSGDKEEVKEVDPGVRRQLLGFDDHIMMARVWFDTGSEGYIHRHIHSQVSYVESGEFEVSIGGKVSTLKAGDAFFIPSNIDHGAVCKKAGVLIDVFSPVREDFLTENNNEN